MTYKIRLFFIINCFSMGGGSEALLAMIMNALYDTGRYDIGVMEIIHADVKEEPIRAGIKVYPYYTKADAPDRKSRMYYVYHEWDKVIDEYIPDDYDVYISFNYLKPTFLLPPDKKSISWIHGDVYDLINKYPNQTYDMSEERELQRKSFGNINRILAISDNTKQSIEDIFPEYRDKTILFPNGIDVKKVRKMAEETTDVVLEETAVIFVGRLDYNKNPLHALEVFRKLRAVREDAHLYYLGYGVLADDVRASIEEMGLSECVHLLGYYDNPFPVIRQANVTLMTSYSEGFPLVLLESVALGVPFVSTVVGGSRILGKDSNVGAVFTDDEEAVDEIIKFLDMDKQIIREACDNTIKEFDLPNYLGRIEHLIQEIIG